MHGTNPPFSMRNVVKDQLFVNDGRAQETLDKLVDLMATEGTIFRQGDGSAMRGVIIRELTAAEIAANQRRKIATPPGLLLPAVLNECHVQDFAETNFEVVKRCKTRGQNNPYEDRPADFPTELARRAVKSRLHSLRTLRGMAYAPIMRGDGTIIGDPEYDDETALWIVAGLPNLNIPAVPTKQDATAAYDILKELVSEHPFETDADRVASVGQIMTAALRPSMQNAPLLVADAAYPRTGKDFLLITCALVGTGYKPTVAGMGDTADEQKKRIGWVLLHGAPFIVMGNINGRLTSAELAQYLTDGGVATRNYGTTGGAKWAPNGNVLGASGNNITLGGDLNERDCASRQDAGMEFPGHRKFKRSPHDDVRNDRARYLGAALTIARWVVRGTDYTAPDISNFNGFDDFNRLIRAPLFVLTGTDPLERAQDALVAARQTRSDRELIDALEALFGHTNPFAVRDIVAELKKNYVTPGDPDPFDILRDTKTLSYKLINARGRRGTNKQLRHIKRPPAGADVAWYQLEALGQAATPNQSQWPPPPPSAPPPPPSSTPPTPPPSPNSPTPDSEFGVDP